jgi:hypothetical protein
MVATELFSIFTPASIKQELDPQSERWEYQEAGSN